MNIVPTNSYRASSQAVNVSHVRFSPDANTVYVSLQGGMAINLKAITDEILSDRNHEIIWTVSNGTIEVRNLVNDVLVNGKWQIDVSGGESFAWDLAAAATAAASTKVMRGKITWDKAEIHMTAGSYCLSINQTALKGAYKALKEGHAGSLSVEGNMILWNNTWLSKITQDAVQPEHKNILAAHSAGMNHLPDKVEAAIRATCLGFRRLDQSRGAVRLESWLRTNSLSTILRTMSGDDAINVVEAAYTFADLKFARNPQDLEILKYYLPGCVACKYFAVPRSIDYGASPGGAKTCMFTTTKIDESDPLHLLYSGYKYVAEDSQPGVPSAIVGFWAIEKVRENLQGMPRNPGEIVAMSTETKKNWVVSKLYQIAPPPNKEFLVAALTNLYTDYMLGEVESLTPIQLANKLARAVSN
jgi:hypothetical protein